MIYPKHQEYTSFLERAKLRLAASSALSRFSQIISPVSASVTAWKIGFHKHAKQHSNEALYGTGSMRLKTENGATQTVAL